MIDPAEIPNAHPKAGERYSFPVVTTGGPNGKLPGRMYFTSVYVQVKAEGISVKSYDRFCKEFDSFTIAPDGTVTDGARDPAFKFYEY